MSKGLSDFKQTNVKRLCRAVSAAGIPIGRVEFDKATGNINIYPLPSNETEPASNPLIERLRKVKG